MQAIVETVFDIVYLLTVITLGFIMVFKAKKNKQFLLFGIMALSLGFGDAFHLVPRAIALCTTGLEDFTFYLGMGKFITSITMTIFYVLLYHIYQIRYNKNNKNLTISIYLLALVRIILCFLPQNEWTSAEAPLLYGILRNIPFLIMGILIIVLFYKEGKNDKLFKYMYLTIVFSFAFYLPVVLFADKVPLIGMLMIPKTIAYVFTVVIGYNAMNKELFNKVKEEN